MNDLIVVICKNNGGDMGIKGYINFNGFNYVTDLTSWKWNDTSPMVYVSEFIGKKTVRNYEVVEYYFRIPQKATANSFSIKTKSLLETDTPVIEVLDIKGNITLSTGIELNSLSVVFLSIPLMMKGKFVLYGGTSIIENTNYPPNSEYRFIYTFADIHALNSNVFTITYVLKDSNTIVSNQANITVAFCDFTGTTICEYHEDLLPNQPYYPNCNSNFYFKDYAHNICINRTLYPNYYIDETNTILKKCYSSCATCTVGGNELWNHCTKCSNGYRKIYNIEGNCISKIELNTIDTSGTKVLRRKSL